MTRRDIKDLLDHYADQVNRLEFIETDPIFIPHQYTKPQDIEIAGLFSATFSWGQRKTIIKKGLELMSLMDGRPYEFVVGHKPKDRRRFEKFVHRTFQYTDTLYFLTFLQQYYSRHQTLEDLFLGDAGKAPDLAGFHQKFFGLENAPKRTRKHIPTPARNSTCKRLNMFLRWMVRSDQKGVDFGLWNRIEAKQLWIPLDVHVDRVARKLNLITRKQTDWKATQELTFNLRTFDSEDPVRYDFALFGMGVLEKQLRF